MSFVPDMDRLLYFFPVNTTFVEADRQLLARHFRVKAFWFDGTNKSRTPLRFFMQLVFLLRHGFRARVLVSHFSGYHSLLPAIFGFVLRKPHFIILNGTECNNFPEFGYGYLRKPLLYRCSDWSLRLATRLLPVSEALVWSPYTYFPARYAEQGLKAFYPGLKTPVTVVYNGVDIEKFRATDDAKRSVNTFITVAAGIQDRDRAAIKGVDLVLELATRLPDVSFTVVGGAENIGIDLPGNVTHMAHVPNEKLAGLMQRHAFYLQLSVSEGFGIALAEAMLCGCVPIVSNVGILPAIAGDSGHVLLHRNVAALMDLVQGAMRDYTPEAGKAARAHILDHYPQEKRERELIQAIRAR